MNQINYSTKVISFTIKPLLNNIAKFFKARHKKVLLARQLSANATIAQYMLKEYPYHTYSSLLFEMNTRAYSEYNSKLENGS